MNKKFFLKGVSVANCLLKHSPSRAASPGETHLFCNQEFTIEGRGEGNGGVVEIGTSVNHNDFTAETQRDVAATKTPHRRGRRDTREKQKQEIYLPPRKSSQTRGSFDPAIFLCVTSCPLWFMEFAQENKSPGRGNAEDAKMRRKSRGSDSSDYDCHSERAARGVEPRAGREESAPLHPKFTGPLRYIREIREESAGP